MRASPALEIEFHSLIVDITWFLNGETKISVFLELGIGIEVGVIEIYDGINLYFAGEKNRSLPAGSDSITQGAIVRVTRCALKLAPDAWSFAARYEADIAA